MNLEIILIYLLPVIDLHCLCIDIVGCLVFIQCYGVQWTICRAFLVWMYMKVFYILSTQKRGVWDIYMDLSGVKQQDVFS